MLRSRSARPRTSLRPSERDARPTVTWSPLAGSLDGSEDPLRNKNLADTKAVIEVGSASSFSPGAQGAPIGATIHAPGEAKLDELIDFVRFVVKPIPLTLLLDEAPRRIASIVKADVASLYLLERDGDELVLRGNVGFPSLVRGRVRLRVGEGITGLAVECGRPISVVHASEHRNYRSFPELDEERYPVFLAVPILGHGRPLGALVVQRAGNDEFSRDDIHLVVALTAPVSTGIRHAQLLDDLREKNRKTGGGTRKVTLPGLPVVSGRALGAVAALRRPAPTQKRPRTDNDDRHLRLAFDVAERAIESLRGRARADGLAGEARFLETYAVILSDGRLRDRAHELLDEGKGVAEALGQIAREVARTANSDTTGDPFLQERARDIEDLCDALLMLASPDSRAELPQKAVLLGNDLTVFDLIVSARSRPVGVALTERTLGPRTRVLLRLLGVPSIVDVGGAFRWAAPGDVALVDADHGFLVINPSKAEIAGVRAQRKQKKQGPERPAKPASRKRPAADSAQAPATERSARSARSRAVPEEA
jgi:phosphotransferase system enzyme I (PtsP)